MVVVVTRPRTMDGHLLKNHEVKGFSYVCKTAYASRRGRDQHMDVSHHDMRYECQDFHAIFVSKGWANEHNKGRCTVAKKGKGNVKFVKKEQKREEGKTKKTL